jgi:hypothetical protein
MASFVERAIGAARLDAATYEEVEADSGALGQAMGVVVAASVAGGVGSAMASGQEGIGIVGGILFSLVAWFVWAFLTYLVGTRILPTPETKSDLGEMLRTTGFSAAPGVIAILGFLPVVGGLVLLAAQLWMLASMVVAVRQALDYTSTGRAIAVCVIGFVAYLLIATVLAGALLGGLMATGGGPAPAAM